MTFKKFFHLMLLPLALLSCAAPQVLNYTKPCTRETQTLAARTVFDFWHESTQECGMDAQSLFRIRRQISQQIGQAQQQQQRNGNKISDLLHGHVSSALVQALFSELIASISTKSFSIKPDIDKLMNELYSDAADKTFVIEIWQKVLDEAFAFMNEEDILQQLLALENEHLKLNLLEYLLMKYESSNGSNEKFLPLLAFGVGSTLKQRAGQQQHSPIGDPSIARLLGKVPEQLLLIFQSWSYNVSILNSHYNEYVFPQQLNGRTGNKRYLYNFVPGKNSLRVKGKFKLQFNSKGFLVIGAPYDSSYKYLRAEEKSVFICLDCAADGAKWWQVLWPFSDARPVEQQFVLFQNVATRELLCSTSISDENLVLVSALDFAQHKHDSQCHWKVVKRTR